MPPAIPAIMRIAATLVLASFLAACGYKGPLYLPKPSPEPHAVVPAPPAQDTRKAKEGP